MALPTPIRVLYVTPFAQQVSGPDESLIGLLRGLRGMIEPVVALPPGSPQKARYEDAGATVVELPMQRIRRATDVMTLAAYGGLFLPDTLQFIRLIRRYRIDLVHTNMEVVLQSGLAARLSGVPSVYHIRGTSFATPRRLCDVLVSAINKLADEIVVISKAVGNIFYERGVRDKVSVIFNSVDPTVFDHVDSAAVAALRRELTGGEGGALVATVGRINPRKGLDCFVRAAARLASERPDVRFAIVGDMSDASEESYMKSLRELAAGVGLGERLVFAPAHRNIAELMSAIDVFVMTSVNEGFGRVVIEAMAARRPVVASAVGGITEIVEDGVTGKLVTQNQPEAFADAVLDILASPGLSASMGAKGRGRVEEYFSDDAQLPAVMAVYSRVLRRRGQDLARVLAS